MTDAPTAEEIALAKRWAAMQVPPVTVEISQLRTRRGEWRFWNQPDWLSLDYFESEDAAWAFLTTVFNAVRPVIAEEERNRAYMIAKNWEITEGEPIVTYEVDGKTRVDIPASIAIAIRPPRSLPTPQRGER